MISSINSNKEIREKRKGTEKRRTEKQMEMI